MDRSRVPGARDRVHAAIQEAVEQAEQALAELRDAETDVKLSALIGGWGRGLAAALEELAVAVDELALRAETAAEPVREPAEVSTPARDEHPERPEQPDLADATEVQLADEARRSREATAELRRESEDTRRGLDG